jgi:hypothetical protein
MATAGNPSAPRHPAERPGSACPAQAGATIPALLGRAVPLGLASFHAWLFWTHATSGRLLEPGTAIRWLLAALLLGGFIALRRLGLPILFGRRALVLWLLVGLLHCHAAWSEGPVLDTLSLPPSLTAFASQLVDAAGGVLLGLGLLIVLARRHAIRPRALPFREARSRAASPTLGSRGFRLSPRPPPSALLVA